MIRDNLFRGTAIELFIRIGPSALHTDKIPRNLPGGRGYGSPIQTIHRVIKKNLLEMKIIQSITMGITRDRCHGLKSHQRVHRTA